MFTEESDPRALTLTLRPIGLVHSPFSERLAAPRQPRAATGVEGQVELFAGTGVEHALEDVSSWKYLWILFWFHKNEGWRPKVLPPRSRERRGVFATRSPYRPNPIGLSVVELLRVEGRVLTVRNLDILDGSPVLDIKPYVAYTDSIPDAASGWLEQSPKDPLPEYEVLFAERALEQLAFLHEGFGLDLLAPVTEVLRLGPEPHAYRRIKRSGSGFVLAHKEWRFEFVAEGQQVTVLTVHSGFRPSSLFGSEEPSLHVHREFVARFG